MPTFSSPDGKAKGNQKVRSPKTLKKADFYKKAKDLLQENVTPLVKKKISRGQSNFRIVVPSYQQIDAIDAFLFEVNEIIQDTDTLTPMDVSRILESMVLDLRDPLSRVIIDELLIPFAPGIVPKLVIDTDIFAKSLRQVEEKIRDLLIERHEREEAELAKYGVAGS